MIVLPSPLLTTSLGVIGMPGPMELIIVAMIFLLLFGNRLPDVMRSLGRSIVEFKKGAREIDGPGDSADSP
jgi:sec-independent protein translocase protein TatA